MFHIRLFVFYQNDLLVLLTKQFYKISSVPSPLVFFDTVFVRVFPKIILVSQFLLFICISYLLKVFRLDTGILRDSCAVLLLKTLSRLPQSVAFYSWFPFRAFVTMICWTSTKVLLNLVPPWIQLCFILNLSKLTFFEFPVLIPSVFYLIHSVSVEG